MDEHISRSPIISNVWTLNVIIAMAMVMAMHARRAVIYWKKKPVCRCFILFFFFGQMETE